MRSESTPLSARLVENADEAILLPVPELNGWGETPEEAAYGVLTGLLETFHYARSNGMLDVCELILEAIKVTEMWRPRANCLTTPDSRENIPLVKQKLVSERELETILRALDEFDEGYRKPFLLRVVFQYPYELVASYCGVPMLTAQKSVKRAIRHVRSVTENDDVLKKKLVEIEAMADLVEPIDDPEAERDSEK